MLLSKLAVLLAALQLLFVSTEGATVTSGSCVQEYQATLRKAASIRETCESAAFYDCCQAKNAMHMEHSVIFEVTNVCSNGPFAAVDKIRARCDMDTDGGGWMVIQRRVAGGTENFTRPWEDYEEGFGNLDGEFWYGLRNIHCLTSREDVELRIDMKYKNGTNLTWTYQLFQVAGPEDKYRLQIGSGVGRGHDAMPYHNNSQFSTYDQDNDKASIFGHQGGHCAAYYKGGWWYHSCYHSNLNGPHAQPPAHEGGDGLSRSIWKDGIYHYVPYIEMKIRPKTCAKTTACK